MRGRSLKDGRPFFWMRRTYSDLKRMHQPYPTDFQCICMANRIKHLALAASTDFNLTDHSAQSEETEHEKYDDDGTDDPDNLVHERCPLMARIGYKRGRPAHIGLVPCELI